MPSHAEFFSPRFHYTFAPHAPQLTIDPGTSLCIICPDSDNMLGDGTLLPPERRERLTGAPRIEGNPCAGPIFIKGAKAGDCIEVKIESIELDRHFGQTGLAPAHGLLTQEQLLGTSSASSGRTVPRHLYRWKIDAAAGFASLDNALGDLPVCVPLNPFVGCIGTCPCTGHEASTLVSGCHGGNIDLPLSGAGSTVLLPVFQDGGQLMLGDLHAAQGHGEIIGGAIETSGRVNCTISLLRHTSIPAPRFRNATMIAAVGLHADLRTAIAQAYAHLLEWMVTEYALNRWDAYNLISQAGSIVIGNLALPPYPVAARILLALISDGG